MFTKFSNILCVYIAITAPVHALSKQEVNVLQNTAMLSIANKWCKDYVINLDDLVEIVVSMSINPAHDPFEEEYQKLASEFDGAVGRMGVNSFSLKAYERFRPGGLVPGLMAPR